MAKKTTSKSAREDKGKRNREERNPGADSPRRDENDQFNDIDDDADDMQRFEGKDLKEDMR